MKISMNQWPFQDPKLEVPTIYKAYVREYPQKYGLIMPYMVQYLHFRILKFPLNEWFQMDNPTMDENCGYPHDLGNLLI